MWFEADFCRFAEKVIRASKGEKGIVEPSFVYLPGVTGGDAIAKTTGTEFFSVPIELGVSTRDRIDRVKLTCNSPTVPRRPSTLSAAQTSTKRSCSRPATTASRATSPRVLSLSRTLLPRSGTAVRAKRHDYDKT